jgi:hypothetical protein
MPLTAFLTKVSIKFEHLSFILYRFFCADDEHDFRSSALNRYAS